MKQEILKAYKFRLYPNAEQEIMLTKTFGCVRFVWNQRVAQFLDWKADEPVKKEPTIKEMKEEFPWLAEVPYNALDQKCQDWVQTKRQYFSKTRKKKLGKPSFKKRGNRESFRMMVSTGAVKFKDDGIHASKLGKLKLKGFELNNLALDTCKSITISKNPSGKYFVSILVREEVELKERTGKAIGIDLGLKDLFILSNVTSISNPKWFRNSQAKLKKAQKHLSRKQKGSARYNKQRVKVAKIHEKIANQRNWFLHNVSKLLIDSYDEIIVEDLAVSNMVKNSKLAKSISDAGWTSFVNMLNYKSNWCGRTFHKIDRFYPSSKTCSCCNHKLDKSEMTLATRHWTCPSCNTHHDRDLNAAINIANKGLNDLYELSSEECSDYIRGDFVRPIESLNSQLARSMKRIEIDISL